MKPPKIIPLDKVTESDAPLAVRPPPRMLAAAEALALIDASNETVAEFYEALTKAIRDGYEWAAYDWWYVADIASEWCAVCIRYYDAKECCYSEAYHWRIPYTRAGRKFTFGEWEAVIRRQVYEPKPDDDSTEKKAEGAGGGGKAENVETEQTFRERAVFDTYTVREGADVTETAPNGERFVAVLEGEGGVIGKINRNRRLYLPTYWQENEDRLNSSIKRAYENGSLKSNPHIVTGGVDHNAGGAQVMTTATILLEAKRSGDRVRVKMGFMDNAAAEQALSLRKYAIPMGVSWEARVKAKQRVMDEKNPYFAQNAEHVGTKYEELGPYIVDRFQIVVDPSALSYLESADAGKVPGDVRSMVEALCRDGSKPVGGACACDVKTEDTITRTEAIDMAKDLKTALENVTPDDIKTAAPALHEAIVKTAVEAATSALKAATQVEPSADLKATTEALAAEKTARESLEKTVAEQKAALDALSAESAEAKRQAAVRTAIEAACVGKPSGDKRRKFLTDRVLDKGLAVEAVAEWVAIFEELHTEPAVGANERVHEEPKSESAPKNGAAVRGYGRAPLSTATTGGAK